MKQENITRLFKLIICLCFLDGILTIAWVEIGIAEEANPFMAWLMSKSYVLFMSIKLALTYISLSLLNKSKDKNSNVQYIILSIAILYLAVTIFHLGGYLLTEIQ